MLNLVLMSGVAVVETECPKCGKPYKLVKSQSSKYHKVYRTDCEHNKNMRISVG